MSLIKPFQAVVYNQQKFKGISRLACPPYDVISPERQDYYYGLDPYNFIHLLLPRESPGEDKYIKAGERFREWLKEGILLKDVSPAVYFYSHQYTLKGEKRIRLGFVALLELDKGDGSVLGHEHTRLEAKEDRLKLIRQAGANLSPIFVVFPDKKRIVQKLYRQVISQKPFIDIVDDEKSIHKLWRIDDPAILSEIESKMSQEKIFIADGHHRYEVACSFRQELRQKFPHLESPSFNYILAYFTNTDSRGLSILAIHRLVKLPAVIECEKFSGSLRDYFDLEEVKDRGRFLFLMEKSGRSEHVLGVYVNRKFLLLRLKNVRILDKLIADKPREYRSLDVSILNRIILKKILDLNLDDKARITFNPSMDELIRQVDTDPSYVAFFLNPVKISQMMDVALGGNKMPPKSTYFYPKVASGLLVHKFKEF
ncbi:MAG: DUF1015 domain-containing protein [Candidatus Omnitrophica bacterium]|nr:DUF1015 domain-containing protein [Candidatus Omnitrophota bacterium]